MARPVKWSRDLHAIREHAARNRTETWSRRDIERLFGVGRATAQSLMKAIGEVQPVAGAHFVGRNSLLSFLDAMLVAPDLDRALRERMLEAAPAPRPKPLRLALPLDLRTATVKDLPGGIRLSPGRLEIVASSAEGVLESLVLLAQVMQNDLVEVQLLLEPSPSPSPVKDEDLQTWLSQLRATAHGSPRT